MWTPDQPFTNLRMQQEYEQAHPYEESPMKKHTTVKKAVVEAISKAYDDAYGLDQKYQAGKPDFLKQLDKHVDKALRPLFT